MKVKEQLEQDLQTYEQEKELMEKWVLQVKKEVDRIYQENKAIKEELEFLQNKNEGLERKMS